MVNEGAEMYSKKAAFLATATGRGAALATCNDAGTAHQQMIKLKTFIYNSLMCAMV